MFILKKVNSLKQSITIHLVAQDSNRSMPIMIIFQSFDIPPATSSYLSKVNQLSPRKVPAPPKHAWLDRILVGIVQLLVQVQVPNVSIYTVSRCPESFHLVIPPSPSFTHPLLLPSNPPTPPSSLNTLFTLSLQHIFHLTLTVF